MVFEQLAQAVLNFVNWGITIVVIMLIWEVIQLFRGGTEERGESKLTDWESNPLLNKLGLMKKAKATEKVRRAASREETAMLNEYVEEKKELQKIDEAVNEARTCLKVVNSSLAVGSKVPVSSVKDSFDTLSNAVNKAGRETSRLKRNTWRERRKMKQLYEALDEAGLGKGDVQKIKALENNILIQHNGVIQNLATAAGAVKRAQTVAAQLSSAKALPNVLTTLNKALLGDIIPALKNTHIGQQLAYKDTEAMIAKIRAVWK